MGETKICNKCGRELPNTLEYFFKCIILKDGLQTQCKECQGYKFHQPKEKIVPKEGYKICSHCNQELPATKEYFHKSGEGLYSICKKCKNNEAESRRKQYSEEQYQRVLKNNRKSYQKHKKEYSIRNKKWRDNNKEYIKKYMDIYSPLYYKKNKEKILKQSKSYYASHTEQHSQWRKEYKIKNYLAIQSKNKIYYNNNKNKSHLYYIEHKQEHRYNNMKRKMLKKKVLSVLTKDEWGECLKYFNNLDAYTGLPMITITQDHIIPVSKGGAYIKQNIIPCEFNINASKQDSDMETWYRKQSFFSEERLTKIHKWMGVKDNTQQLKII